MKYNYTQPANELQRFANMVEFPDAEPTENSAQLVTSGGVYDAIQAVEEEAKQLSYNSLMEDTASGAIASFPDGAENVPVKELTADIEPIQDLHGQASPWPAGGGKNKLDVSGMAGTQSGVTFTVNADGTVTTSGTFSSAVYRLITYTIKLTAGETYVVSGAYANKQIRLREYDSDNTLLETTTFSDTGTVTINANTASCDVYLIVSSLTANNTLSLMISSEGGDFAPYSNICPISGYTGAEIPVTNKNLVLSSVANCGVNETGTVYTTQAYKLFVAPVKEGETYTITTKDNTAVVYAFFNSVPTIGSISYNGSRVVYFSSQTTATLTAPMTGYIAFRSDSDFVNAQLELGSSATQYEAPSATIYSVSWSDHGTIYKGTLSYLGNSTWKVASDTVKGQITSSTAIYAYGGNKFYIALPQGCESVDYCENLKAVGKEAPSSLGDNSICVNTLVTQVYFRNNAYTSVEAWQDYLTDTPIVYYYKVAPVEFTVTGPDPETLLGDNNIWSNTGDISVRYRCNTALYIEKKLGA